MAVYVATINLDDFETVQHQSGRQQFNPDNAPRRFHVTPYELPSFADFGRQGPLYRLARQEITYRLVRSYQRRGNWDVFSMGDVVSMLSFESVFRSNRPEGFSFLPSLLDPPSVDNVLSLSPAEGFKTLYEAVWELVEEGALNRVGEKYSTPALLPTLHFIHLMEPYRLPNQ